MIRLFSSLITLGLLAGGGWWVWNNVPEVRDFVEEHIDTSSFTTLEVRHSAEEIMAANQSELLGDGEHAYLEPALKFYPYLLMEVKYSREGKSTQEGVILWGLDDGEMVTDASNWGRSHGFEDCINQGANGNDFQVLNAIARHGNIMRRDELVNSLHVQESLADRWIDSCRKKKLIVQQGSSYRLHFQSPKLNVRPQTQLRQWLVTTPYKHAEKVGRTYSPKQIQRISQAAFGEDFTVRSTREVFLPVYSIVVQNPDGTVATTYWNALNGKRLSKTYY